MFENLTRQPVTAFGNISKSILQITFTAAGIVAAGFLLEFGKDLFIKNKT
jgi:hypothetical protein